MCMINRKQVSIEKVSAFKVFTRDKDGLLQSVFVPTFKDGLKYPSNERIRVDSEESNFFAFESFDTAIFIARQGRRKWNMVKGKLIVLPVTMFEVVSKGEYFSKSEDIQCMDSYYPSFESKEIIVHDTEETRNQFYNSVLKQWLNSCKHFMSNIEKEALVNSAPHLAQFV